MQLDENEERLLRSVALQNAKAVLLARERAERELIGANQRIVSILESIADGFIALDKDWRFIFINRRAEEILRPLNRSKETLLGESHWDVFSNTLGTEFEEHFRRAMEQQVTAHFEHFYAPLSAWFDIRAYPSPEGLSIYFHDITQRKKAELEGQRLTSVLERSLNEIYIFDPETLRFEYVNEGARRNLGYTMEEMRTKTPLDLKPEFTEARFREMVAPLLSGAKEKHVFYTVHRRANGTDYPVEVHLQAVTHAGQRVFLAVILDITDRKKAEEELRKAQEELSHHAEDLEQQVALRTASLREAIAQLEEFSYTVSHDLRAPLRAIAGYTRLFSTDYGSALPPEAHSYLDKISRSTERMERLVRDVLTMSRVARAEINLHPISLQPFIAEIVEQHPEMQSPAADLSITTPHIVIADDASLNQAISNLLVNAVKFVPDGVVPIVRVTSERKGEKVRIWVEDNGIGINPEHRSKLFGMFQRLTTNLQYEGTGIGLAIVRRAVERMGGTVGVESKGTGGSRFWLEVKGQA